MVLLLGGSGAGKTTYVNAVTGYEKANAKVLLNGKNIYTEYSRMLFDIGFVPQQDLMRGTDTVKLTLSDAASLRLPSGVPKPKGCNVLKPFWNSLGFVRLRNSP